MENIKTTTRNAYDPDTGEKCQIEFPTLEEVRNAILNLHYPLEGITILDAAKNLSEYFKLDEEQKAAKIISKGKYLDLFYYDLVAPSFRYLLKKGRLHQPNGKGKPYSTVEKEDYSPEEDRKEKDRDQKEEENTVEAIDKIYQSIHEELAAELLDEIKNNTPTFFEELVIDLLVAMGYGGSREDAEAVGRSGDGGIDGVINEDRLGLDVVYVQAKRWETNVGEPPIRDFIGALDGKGAQKGVFITTSGFNQSAERFAERSTKKIILINGTRLAELMIEHDVGVSTTKTYEIKRVDSDYFDETT